MLSWGCSCGWDLHSPVLCSPHNSLLDPSTETSVSCNLSLYFHYFKKFLNWVKTWVKYLFIAKTEERKISRMKKRGQRLNFLGEVKKIPMLQCPDRAWLYWRSTLGLLRLFVLPARLIEFIVLGWSYLHFPGLVCGKYQSFLIISCQLWKGNSTSTEGSHTGIKVADVKSTALARGWGEWANEWGRVSQRVMLVGTSKLWHTWFIKSFLAAHPQAKDGWTDEMSRDWRDRAELGRYHSSEIQCEPHMQTYILS